jgi:hypothetical protein
LRLSASYGRDLKALGSAFVNLDVRAINSARGKGLAWRKRAFWPRRLPSKRANCLREIVRKRTLCLIAAFRKNL